MKSQKMVEAVQFFKWPLSWAIRFEGFSIRIIEKDHVTSAYFQIEYDLLNNKRQRNYTEH